MSVRVASRHIGLASIAAAFGCFGFGGLAFADVLDIRPDGSVAVYSGPAIHSAAGASPISYPVAVRRQYPTDVSAIILSAAQRYALSADLIAAVAWQESRFRQDAVSRAGAVGVMQLMGGTARDLGVDRYDVEQNIHGGAAYLRLMLTRYGDDLPRALAAYNAGPGAVDRYGGVPPFAETRAYVSAILGRLAALSQTAAPPALSQR